MGQVPKSQDAVNLRAKQLLREAIEASGLSQSQIEARSGVKRSTIANIASPNRVSPIYASQLVAIAIALDVEPRAWVDELESLARSERSVDDLARRRTKKRERKQAQDAIAAWVASWSVRQEQGALWSVQDDGAGVCRIVDRSGVTRGVLGLFTDGETLAGEQAAALQRKALLEDHPNLDLTDWLGIPLEYPELAEELVPYLEALLATLVEEPYDGLMSEASRPKRGKPKMGDEG